MTLKNKTNSKTISNNLFQAKNFKDNTLGLIAKNSNQGLFLKTRFGIHTFFMNHKIDVIILDKQNKVVKIKEDLKPFRIFIWNPRFDQVVELPQRTIGKTQTKLGDRIIFTK